MNIIKNRYLYFLISLLIIIPGLIFLILNLTSTGKALPLGIDFPAVPCSKSNSRARARRRNKWWLPTGYMLRM